MEFTFHRAHDESRVKSERLKERWAQRRLAMRKKEVVSRRLPFWISAEDGRLVLNHKAAWVVEAFRMAVAGAGYVLIAQKFNKEAWTVRRAATVDRRLVYRLLRNRQVIGEHQPRTFAGSTDVAKRPTAGEVIADYFPPAVPLALFHKAQAELATRKLTGRGRGQGTTNNLFKGLMHDLRDGGPIYQHTKPGCRYISSWWAQQGRPGACPFSFPYDTFERALLRCCREITPALLVPPSDVDADIARAGAELEEVGVRTARARERLRRAPDAETEEVVTEHLAELRQHDKALRAELDALQGKRATDPAEQMAALHTFLDVLAAAPVEEVERLRTNIRALIGSLVESIGVHIQARSQKTRRCWVLIRYKTGLYRKLLIEKDGTVVHMADDEGVLRVPDGDGWR